PRQMRKLNFTLAAFCALSLSATAQQAPSPAPVASNAPANPAPATPETPAPIEPPISAVGPAAAPMVPAAPVAPDATPIAPAATNVTALGSSNGTSAHALNEFQGDDVSQVLRLLARQAKINLVVSDKVDSAQPPLKVTMRLEDKTPIEAIKIIVTSKGLIMDEQEGVYYIKTKEEKESEPTQSAFYTFSYGS